MTQSMVERRSPVRQGGYDRARVTTIGEGRDFIPLTEDDLIISYSLNYKVEPNEKVETSYRNCKLVISLYKNVINSRVFTHSIEQYLKTSDERGNNAVEKWYKVSVFCKDKIDIEEVRGNIEKALIFSRVFKVKGSKAQKTMTQERTTNLFGRVFASIGDVRTLMFDSDKYGYSLVDVVLKMAEQGEDCVPAPLLRLWERASITPFRVQQFIQGGYRIYGGKCILCHLCELASCKITFKPAGIWLEVIMDVFPNVRHIKNATELNRENNNVSGVILDYGHMIAYRPGSNALNRQQLHLAKILRWSYRIYRALKHNVDQEKIRDWNRCLLFCLELYQWNMSNVMLLCRCYLLLNANLVELDPEFADNTAIKYSDQFHKLMISSNQLNAEVYQKAKLWFSATKLSINKGLIISIFY